MTDAALSYHDLRRECERLERENARLTKRAKLAEVRRDLAVRALRGCFKMTTTKGTK